MKILRDDLVSSRLFHHVKRIKPFRLKPLESLTLQYLMFMVKGY